jgi:hypothetical protein
VTRQGKVQALGTPVVVGIEGTVMQCETRGFEPNPSDDTPMDTITETQLKLMLTARPDAVEYFRAVETEEGYAFRVKLKTFKEEKPVYTMRNLPKLWVSLDRLAKHLGTNYGNRPPLLIVDIRSSNHEIDLSSGP